MELERVWLRRECGIRVTIFAMAALVGITLSNGPSCQSRLGCNPLFGQQIGHISQLLPRHPSPYQSQVWSKSCDHRSAIRTIFFSRSEIREATPAPHGWPNPSRFPTYAPHAPSALLLSCNPVFRIYDAVHPLFFKQVSRLARLHKHSFRRCRIRLATFTSTRQRSSARVAHTPINPLLPLK